MLNRMTSLVCWTFSATLVLFSLARLSALAEANADNPAVLLAKVECSDPLVTEAALEKALFSNYSSRSRPRKKPQAAVDVSFSLVLEAIKDIHEKEHQITLAGYVYVNWHDDYLAWNTTFPNFSCIKVLIVPATSVWLPDIALMNAPRKYDLFEAPGEKVRLYSDGFVHFRPGGLFSAACAFDLTYFPFDDQLCILRFQSWMYLHTYMTISLEDPPITLAHWTESEEWELKRISGHVKNIYYSNPVHPYDGVTFKLHLKRKVAFYIMNVIAPSSLISFMELTTFTLPSHEVIKIHVSFTSLLAYTVFQLMIIPEMPTTSEHTPLLSVYIILEMGFIGFALFGQGLVFLLLDRAERNSIHPPYRFLLTIAKFVAPIIRVTAPPGDSDQDGSLPTMDQAAEKQQGNKSREIFFDEHSKQLPSYYYDRNEYYNSVLSFPGLLGASCKKYSQFNDIGSSDSEEDANNSSQQHFHHHQHHHHYSSVLGEHGKLKTGPNFVKWMFVVRVIDRSFAILYLLAIFLIPVTMFLIIPNLKPSIEENDYEM